MHLPKVLGIWLHTTCITNIKYITTNKLFLLIIGGGSERGLICYIL